MSGAPARVAVVGIGCRFPGGADSSEAFWQLLEEGRDVIGPMPAGRFDVERFVHPEPGTPGKMVTADGGFLQDIDRFDASFFGLSPREARKIDPQHRLLLEVAWEALEDAGIAPASLAGRRVGVFVGIWSGEYENVMYRTPADLDFHSITGGGRYAASGRISYALDLRGPALTVDTGCSASLVALHLARQAILAGDADLAIVGAANLVLQPHVNIGYSRSGMLSVGGRCRFGDAGAAGYVRSDGAAAVVLKPLDAALADRDRVRGVVLATAVNADGRGSGQLATPSTDAQAALLEQVYTAAGVDPATVPYVEAHGTGTRAGDPVELEALGRVLGHGRNGYPLLVGSVKTNIGHTEAAAGMAGLIKTLLALEHRRIPANLHLRERHEEIRWDDLRVEIPVQPRDWPVDAPLYAGVSSFGITGTNAHAVIAAAPEVASESPSSMQDGPRVVAVSGASPEALNTSVVRLRAYLRETPGLALRDVSYTSTVRRDHHTHRLAVVADTVDDVAAALDAHAAGESVAAVSTGEAGVPAVAFVFSGQGSQWVGMTRGLLGWAPVFTATLERLDALVRDLSGWSVRDVLLDDNTHRLEHVEVIQPTLTCVQIALAEQLRAWGVLPRAVVGHSMGEVAAAYIAGALSLEDAVRVIVTRSRLLAEIAGAGAMALLDLDERETAQRIANVSDRVSIAAVNGPRSTVISGDPAIIDTLLENLDDEGVFCRRVKVDVASHSPQTEPLLPQLAEELAVLRPMRPGVPFYSTPRPNAPTDTLMDAAYWVDNLRQPVQLKSAVKAMIANGIDTFVEIAPHPVLLSSLGDIAADADAPVRTLAGPRRDESEPRRLLDLMAKLHVSGVPVAWDELASRYARVLRLPTYAWQRERHWLDRWEDWSGDASKLVRAESARPDTADRDIYEISWWPVETPTADSSLPGVWFLVPDAGGAAEQLAELLRARGGQAIVTGPADLAAHFESARRMKLPIRGLIHMAGLDGRITGAASPENVLRMSAGGALETIHALLGLHASMATWWITRGVQAVPGRAAERACWPGAAIWGLVRTLWEEHPELDAHLVDADGSGAQAARQVLRSLMLHAEPQLAFDSDTPFAARLVAAGADAVRAAERLSVDGAWLITGGLGALGGIAAEELVQSGARRLVLLSRTPLPPRREWATLSPGPAYDRVQRVLRLESLGASVHIAAVDAGDLRSLATWLAEYRAEQWPEIRGIVHCAGALDNRLLRDLKWSTLLELLRGKAVAAHNLDVLLPDAERSIYFSSTVPVLPQTGQANYAAANAVLDALAASRNAAGRRTISIGWGVWKNAGLVSDANVQRHVAGMEAGGQRSLDEDEARAHFRWTFCSDRAHVVVAPMDWTAARARLTSRPGAAFYRELTGTAETPAPRATLRDVIAEAVVEQRTALLVTALRAQVARILDVAPERIAPTQPLGRQGLDSLMALEFRNRTEAELDLRLPASLTWNYPTLEKLAEHLLQRLDLPVANAAVTEHAVEVAAVEVATGLDAAVRAEINQLSDDEILQQLRLEA